MISFWHVSFWFFKCIKMYEKGANYEKIKTIK